MKRIDKESRLLTGVYAIQNTHTESVYIGYTKNSFQSRLTQHLSRLAHNAHDNRSLQNDWNEYGKDSFEFIIIELISVGKMGTMRKRERNWINNHHEIGINCHNILCTTPTTSDYVCVSLPQSLIDEIDKVVGTLGYTSRTEFIKDACRRYLED